MSHATLTVTAAVLSLITTLFAITALKPVTYGRPGQLMLQIATALAVSAALWAALGQYLLTAAYGLCCAPVTALGIRAIRHTEPTSTTIAPVVFFPVVVTHAPEAADSLYPYDPANLRIATVAEVQPGDLIVGDFSGTPLQAGGYLANPYPAAPATHDAHHCPECGCVDEPGVRLSTPDADGNPWGECDAWASTGYVLIVPAPLRAAIELIVDRDPDSDTTLTFIKNGRPVTAQDLGIRVFDVDPGRSGANAQWRAQTEQEAASASPAVAETLRYLASAYTR